MLKRLGALCATAFMAATIAAGPAAAQDMPAPGDEAALYERAKAEGSLVWYTGGALDTSQAIAASFEKAYPGVKVEVLRLAGAAQYQRFMEETGAGQNIADILWIGDYPSMQALVADELVAEWRIPTADRFDERYRMGGRAYAFNRVDSVIVYNDRLVSEEEARLLEADWRNILDPRFKGRFATTTAKCGACYVAINLFTDPALSSVYPEDFLEKVGAQGPAVYNDFIAMVDRIVAGENDFAYWSFESIAATKRAQGAPVKWVYPKPTPSFPSTWMAVSGKAPHPAAARLFINWVGSEAGARSIMLDYFGTPTMSGIADERAFASEDWYRGPAELYNVDFNRWIERYDADMARWIAAISR